MIDISDIFEQVRESRSRRAIDERMVEVYLGLLGVESYLSNLRDGQTKALRYIPIALYACIETWTRMAICDLINFGSPYLENSGKLIRDRKIDFDILASVDKKSFTVGDVVSRMQRSINVESIFSRMSALMEIDFREKFVTACDRFDMKSVDSSKLPIIKNVDETLEYVSLAITLRHIFCHEIASAKMLKRDEMAQCIAHTKLFLKAAEQVVQNHQYPNMPTTTREMRLEAVKDRNEAREKLERLKSEISKNLTPKQLQHFSNANEAWEKFVSESAEIEGLEFEGGTNQPVIITLTETAYIGSRIEQLEHLKSATREESEYISEHLDIVKMLLELDGIL